MTINLNSVGMEKGQKYETIITTLDDDNTHHAAPIGVTCKSEDEIICKIFKTSKTLKNICNRKKFNVNITYDPILFTLATIDNIPSKYYNQNTLKNIDAYFKCEVLKFKESVNNEDSLRKTEAAVIIGKVKEIQIKNTYVKPINRAMHYLIEALVNYTRLEIVNKQKQEYYLERLKESERIITKVGSLKEKEALNILKDEISKKGFNLQDQ